MRKISDLSITLVALATACSSAPSHETIVLKPLCSGNSPLQKYIWTISFYQGIPKGMELEQVTKNTKVRSEMQDRMSDHFVMAMLYQSSSQQESVKALKPFGDLLQPGFIQIGPANFVHCSNANCEGLRDPVTGKIVLLMGKHGETDHFRRQVMYYSEGTIDPDESEFDRHRRNPDGGWDPIMSWYSYRAYNPYMSWPVYLKQNQFPGGNFLSENYFLVPDSKRKDLCLRAGFEEDCFGLPQYNHQNDFIPPKKCDIREMSCNSAFSTDAPFRYQFLRAHNGMCGNSCFDHINDLLRSLKANSFLRRKWEDAITKDIFLKLSISQTRKVEKDWIIARTEWNPTLFCQYARPNFELLSQ